MCWKQDYNLETYQALALAMEQGLTEVFAKDKELLEEARTLFRDLDDKMEDLLSMKESGLLPIFLGEEICRIQNANLSPPKRQRQKPLKSNRRPSRGA